MTAVAESTPKPLELIVRDEDGEPVAYACPECRLVFFPIAGETDLERAAQEAATHCAKQCTCGVRSSSFPCVTCRARALLAVRKQQFARARKIAAHRYRGPLYCPDLGEDSDPAAYFETVDALREHYSAVGAPVPMHAWACTTLQFRVSARALLEQALADHHDGAVDAISPEAEQDLQRLLNAWCTRQPKILTYEPDYSRAVVVGVVSQPAPARVRRGASADAGDGGGKETAAAAGVTLQVDAAAAAMGASPPRCVGGLSTQA